MEKKLFLLVLSLLCSGIVNAAILNVPTEYYSIQTGIDSSSVGDTVLVQPGTYVENINYNGKNITVASLFLTTADTSYISQTVIDGDSLDSVVRFENGEDSTTVLSGFTITNGNANVNWPYKGGGICCDNSSPSLANLKLRYNSTGNGGGISCDNNSSATLRNITIMGNSTSSSGSGISCTFSSLVLMNVTINDNCAGGNGGGISLFYTYAILRGVTITDNFANFKGGGIYCDYSQCIIDSITIMNNCSNGTNSDGGGLGSRRSTLCMQNILISGNYARSGGGIYSDQDSILIINNATITNNSADFYGGGICLSHSNSAPSLQDMMITGNSAEYGGGVFCWSSAPNLNNVTIKTNNAYNSGGGMFFFLSSPNFSTINRCNIYSNSAENRGFGVDVFSYYCDSIDVIVDTFTVFTPTDYYASPIDNFTFDILHGVNNNLINSDLYVSVDGDDSNTGTSVDEPFRTIRHALSVLYSDSMNINTIHLASGIYSPSTNGESFPVQWSNYVNLSGSGEDDTIINAAYTSGVLQFLYVSTSLIKNITITNGSAYNGGGIYCDNSSPSLENVTIKSSNAVYDGGGICCRYSSSPSLKNVSIKGNSANSGGGISCSSSSPNLENVNITGNIAAEEGGGIYCDGSYSYVSIMNSIIANNIGNFGICYYYLYPGNPTIRYSNFWNNGIGNFDNCGDSIGVNVTTNANGDSCDTFYNIQLDPLFVDPANNDYHLSWTNYPIPDSTMSPCIDAGDPSSPPDPDGTVTDMGAYYFNQNVSVDEPEDVSDWTIRNFPNPIKNSTTILYSLKKNSHVMISIYNIKGQLVSTLVNETNPKGEYSVEFETKALSSGVYFYKIQTDDIFEIKKMIVIR